MDDVPPPEAFEPQPEWAQHSGGIRRRAKAAITLVVVASLIVLAAVEGGGFILRADRAETSATTARLAVVDAAGALTTVDSLGGSVVAYSVPGVRFQFPTWSPDGSRIAAIGAGADGTGVYVFTAREADQVATSPVVAYTSAEQPPFYLYWTPDGRQLTFLTTEVDGLALRIVPADGSSAATVVRAGAPMYWDFVDDGRLLVHSGSTADDGFFGEIAIDGTAFEGTGRAPGTFRAPVVSGDDRYRAYLGAGDGVIGEVVRESRDDSGTTRIRVFGPAAVGFSPTGDQLAFVAPDEFTSGSLPLPVGPLRVLDPGASEPRTLLTGSSLAFFWSPTGKVIAVFRLDSPNDTVTEVRAGGVTAREAAAGLALRLSFVNVADGTILSQRSIQASDLFVNQVLPFFDQYALSHRFWAPDGTAIVLPVVGDGDVTRLLAIPADGSDARLIATAEIGSWSP
jgi:TolB protein